MFDFFKDPIASILFTIKEMLISFAGQLFNGYFYLIDNLTNSSYLTGSLNNLFGTELVWGLVTNAHSTVVIPLAESILAFFMLVQLVKISQRIDATATLPAVKDIIILAVTYVIFHWLIVNSLDILTALFDEINNLSSAFVSSDNPSDKVFSSAVKYDEEIINNANIGSAFLLVLCAAISFFVGIVAYMVTLVVSFSRALQLYVMATFAPIPLSLLGFEETRQSGISFLKNFAAAALAGVIMVFLLVAFPSILSSVVLTIGDSAPTAGTLTTALIMTKFFATGSGNAVIAGAVLLALFTTVAVTIFLLLGLVKSGAWAKEILGA